MATGISTPSVILRYQHFQSLGTFIYKSFFSVEEALKWATEHGWVHTDPSLSFPPVPYYRDFKLFTLLGEVVVSTPIIQQAILKEVRHESEVSLAISSAVSAQPGVSISGTTSQ